jgi:hypothetical protein
MTNNQYVIGIVGHGKDKFTSRSATLARVQIHNIITEAIEQFGHDNVIVCSGHSPVGGVDIWAEEIADSLHLKTHICAPATMSWNGQYGFKDRNLNIAMSSNEVHVILVDSYPPNYRGRKFPVCYHCMKHPEMTRKPHAKSGGCWTGWKAYDFGKPVFFHIIKNDHSKGDE